MNIALTPITFSISAIPSDVAKRVREALRDDFSNSLQITYPGAVPCRHCLRMTHVGEPAIVFAYKPFDFEGPYAEIGPVYVHAQECRRYSETARFPSDFGLRVLTMRGYNDEHRIEAAELSSSGDPESSIASLLANDRVRFIHVRNPAWGCYDFQVDRCS